MGKDSVDAMFVSLQSNKSRVDGYELFGLVTNVSLSTVATLLIKNCITLIVNVVWLLITEKYLMNYLCVFAKFSVLVQLSFYG